MTFNTSTEEQLRQCYSALQFKSGDKLQNGQISLSFAIFIYFDFAVLLTKVIDFVCPLFELGLAL